MPKVRPPASTFGQLMLISYASAWPSSSRASRTCTYSSMLWPETFTMEGTPWALIHGRSTSHRCLTPGFCRPMELSMPLGVSAMRGESLPSHPLSETPLVVTAPMRDTSTKSEYSRPAANVPDASVTGLGMTSPPRLTSRFSDITTPHPSR